MAIITKLPAKRFFLRAGAKRVSDKAVIELIKLMEEKAAAIAAESRLLSGHAGRRTVTREDMKAARKQL